MGSDLAFLICTEGGQLEPLSLLLVRSLRRYAGALRDAPVYSFAPRPGRGVSSRTAAALRAMGVVHDERPLNAAHPDYPLANKVLVCEYAEREIDAETLVFADSDQIFLNDASALTLAADEDAALRPEPVRRIGAGSPEHESYTAWRRLLDRQGVTQPRFTRTQVEGEEIFAYWNSGLVSVRRTAGLFGRWRRVFEEAWSDATWTADRERRYYTEQVSLSVALVASGARVRTLPGACNYHVVIHDALPPADRIETLEEMTTLHYHKLLEKSTWRDPFRRVASFQPEGERTEWLRGEMRELGVGRQEGLRGILDKARRMLRKRLTGARAGQAPS